MYSFFNWDYYLVNDYFLIIYNSLFFFFLTYIYIVNSLLFKKLIVNIFFEELKYFKNNWYQLFLKYLKNIKYFLNIKNTILFNFLIINMHYIVVYLKNKSWYISMIIRLMEINKEKEKYIHRKIYIKLQFLEFFYIRIILNKIYAIINRIIFTKLIIFIKYIVKNLIKYLILIFSFDKLNILILYFTKYILYKIYLVKYNIKIFIMNIYEIIKLETFIIYINENNFIAGLLNYMYIFINNKITTFNKLETWEANRLPNLILNKIKFYFNNTHNYFLNKNNKINNINFLNWYNYFVILCYFLKNNYNLLYVILKSKIWYIFYLFFYLGFFYFIIYDNLKNILYFLNYRLVKYKKYFFLLIYIFIIYKLNLIYIINITNIYFVKYIFNKYLINFIAYFSITFFDLISVLDKKLFNEELNADLIRIWIKDYSYMLNNQDVYFNNTIIGRIVNLLKLDTNDWQLLYEKKSLISKDPAYIKKKWLNYIKKICGLIFNELKMFLKIFKNILIYKFFSVYKMQIFFYSNESPYYYIIKKIITIIYILIIYILCYFKFLYFYILPYYIASIYIYIFWILGKIQNIIYPICYIVNLLLTLSYYIMNIFYIITIIYFYIMLNYVTLLFKYIYILNTLIYIWLWDVIFFNYIDTIYLYYYIFINKNIYINIFKEFLFNYLRIDIFNFTHNYNKYNIIGNKVKGLIVFDLDIIDIEAIKKYGIKGNEINSVLALAPLRYKFRELYMFYSNIFIYNNIFVFNKINKYYHINIYMINIFIYHYIFIIMCIYIFVIYIYNKYIYTHDKYNDNKLWDNIKKNFKYKLLKNDKLFLKALYFYRKIQGKNKNIDNIYNKLYIVFYKNRNWETVINKKFHKIKLSFFKLNINNKLLYNYSLEKFNYKKNFIFFYWRNFIINKNNKNYYIEKSKKMEFFYFFLSLIFRKAQNSSKLYTYLNNYSKIYFYKDIQIKYLKKITNYQSKLINNKFTILYKNEANIYKNVYSLNFRIEIPNFVFYFFWLGFIIYVFIFKFYWRHYNLEISTRIITNFFYFKLLLINNNFMYIFDSLNYWFFMFSMFDNKNISYETSNYYLMESKMVKLYRRFSLSKKFIINNDSLYLYKKNLAYNGINLEKRTYCINSLKLIIFYKLIIFLKLIIFYKILLYPIIIFYKKKNDKLKIMDIIENYKKKILIHKYYIYYKKFFL